MAGLIPAIHDLLSEVKEDVDARNMRGHDVERLARTNKRTFSLQRLDAHDLALMVGVPDRHWIG
jgi:hypothetical protein